MITISLFYYYQKVVILRNIWMIKKNSVKKRYLKKNIFITYLNVPGETLLLADVFENSRNMCINIYELDPLKFLSTPGLAWQAALKNIN